MALTTSLAGRVRNTSLPKSHALLPLLEAVVNGLQAIDARFGDDVGKGRLTVTILRSGQEAFDFGVAGPLTSRAVESSLTSWRSSSAPTSKATAAVRMPSTRC